MSFFMSSEELLGTKLLEIVYILSVTLDLT